MLSPQDFARVTSSAYKLWTSFLVSDSGTKSGHSAQSLMSFTRQIKGRILRPQINPTAQALFIFSTSQCPHRIWLLAVPKLYPFAPPSQIVDPENITSGWARTGESVNIRILQTSAFLNMVSSYHAGLAGLRVLLHEIGHVQLHADNLWPRTQAAPPALPIATGDQEEEAWLFGDTILNLARAELVADARRRGEIGDMWRSDLPSTSRRP